MSSSVKDERSMELSLWGGGWGLPSIDPESLQALAAVRFSGAPTKLIECNNPWNSPGHSIPFFRQLNSETLFSAYEINVYLRSKNFSGDYGLTSIQCAETLAYGQLIWDSLHVAYQYFCFINESNYNDVIRPFYGKRLPWVYKVWYPEWRLRHQAKEIINTMYRDAESQPESVQPFVLDKAKKCIQLLSEKLGKNEFLMGTTSPTTIDGMVFSYLAVFWKVQLPVNPLRECILSTPSLERYLVRISQRYFPVNLQGISVPVGNVYGPDGEVVREEESHLSGTQKALAAVVASGAMLLYALKNGMVKLPRGPGALDSSQQDENEDYWE